MAGAEQNPRLSLVPRLETRDGTLTKDSVMRNFMRDGSSESPQALKRPGLSLVQSIASGTPQILFKTAVGVFSIVGNNIAPLGGATVATVPGGASQAIDVFVNDQTVTVFIRTLGGGYLFNYVSNVLTTITNANYPTQTVSGVTYLDGTYYVMDVNGNIWGSAVQDATTWTGLAFTQIDATLGGAVCLRRYLNYVVAFGLKGLQLYYDAANPSPGVPLGAVTNASYLTGCADAGSCVSIADTLIWISRTGQAGLAVVQFSGMQVQPISTPFVERVLDLNFLQGNVKAFAVKIAGQNLYVLTMPNVTLVYSVTYQDWQVWTTASGVGIDVNFLGISSAYDTQGLTYVLLSNGSICQLSLSNYSDTDNRGTFPINGFIRTSQIDGRIINYKFLSALYLIADTTSATISMRYSNDDCQTFSAWTTIDLSSPRKMARKLGKFRHRTFEFQFTANTPLRLEAAELDMTELGNY